MPWRLRSQLALVIAAAMAPAGLVAILQALAGADDQIDQRETVFASEMRATALAERDALRQARSALAAAADAAEHLYLEQGGCGRVLTDLAARRPEVERAVLLNREGQTVCGSGNWPKGHLPQWDAFTQSPHATFTLEPGASAEGMWPVVAVQPTVFMRSDAYAVAAEIALVRLRALSAGAPESRVYGVIDITGQTVAAGAKDAGWLPADTNTLLGSYERSITLKSREGKDRLYISEPLVDGQLWAVASVPKATFLDVIASRDGLTALVPILLWLIAVAVAYLSIDKLVSRHIGYLQRATARIGRGDLETEIKRLDTAPAEIRALGDAIREMARNMRARDADLHDLIERQKSLLLEIHHRVKNNLQMVTSLINIQLRRVKTPDERQALRFLEDRIQSLAIVHHHLYGSEELDRIPLDELVRDICERLKMSMTPVGAQVSFDYELARLVVDSRIATPVALFLTEAVSNAFKHAVPQTGHHEIGVTLRTNEGRFSLEVSNCMAHVAASARSADQRQLGMRLLRSFASQLDGSFEKIVDKDSFRLVLTARIAPRGTEIPAPARLAPEPPPAVKVAGRSRA